MPVPAIILALVKRYRASRRSSTGIAAGDFVVDYKQLLETALAADGEARVEAEQVLRAAALGSGGMLGLDTHSRDSALILKVRLAKEGGEAWLFHQAGLRTPAQERQALAAQFEEMRTLSVPGEWRAAWRAWLGALAEKARAGVSVLPFDKVDTEGNQELLRLTAAVLSWPGDSLIRFASSVLTGSSKRLEGLRPRLEDALRQLSGGEINSLGDVGLLETPRLVLLHGPLVLETAQGRVDLGLLEGPVRISDPDLLQAASITTEAQRCLSVENETTFYELAKLRSGTLLIHTSYPGRGVRTLYQRLPPELPCWHFGDTDPAGYDILRELRQKTQRLIQPLHMNFRDREDSAKLEPAEVTMLQRLLANDAMEDLWPQLQAMLKAGRKGSFEQESLGWPSAGWPFYMTPVPC